MKIFIVYLFIISIISVIFTIYDKSLARKRRYRISETTLLLCAAAGGAAAEFVTMLLIRHKTRHLKFMLGLPVIISLQAAIFTLIFIILW